MSRELAVSGMYTLCGTRFLSRRLANWRPLGRKHLHPRRPQRDPPPTRHARRRHGVARSRVTRVAKRLLFASWRAARPVDTYGATRRKGCTVVHAATLRRPPAAAACSKIRPPQQHQRATARGGKKTKDASSFSDDPHDRGRCCCRKRHISATGGADACVQRCRTDARPSARTNTSSSVPRSSSFPCC